MLQNYFSIGRLSKVSKKLNKRKMMVAVTYLVNTNSQRQLATVSAIIVLLILFIYKRCSNPLAQLNDAKYTHNLKKTHVYNANIYSGTVYGLYI